jgi:hypothetical protein
MRFVDEYEVAGREAASLFSEGKMVFREGGSG